MFGRDGGIWTHDPLNPIQVRYQTALHPDNVYYYIHIYRTVKKKYLTLSSLFFSFYFFIADVYVL